MAQSNASDDLFTAYKKPLVPKATPKSGDDLFAAYKTPLAAQPPPAPDFTTNPKKEGTYRMGSYDYSGGKVTRPEIGVPFSRIEEALTAGYQLHPDEKQRYHHDVDYKGQGPTLSEGVGNLIERLTEPLPDRPLEWNTGERTVGSFIRSAPAALTNVGNLPINVVTRTYRGLAGLPGQTVQTVKGIRHGDPEALESLDPATMAESEARNYQSDVETLGPTAALANLGGDAATMYLSGKAIEAPQRLPVPKSLAEIKQIVRERIAPTAKYAPQIRTVAGVDIPVGKGEADPTGKVGQEYLRLKRKGVGREKFEALERVQQETVKDVIRNTAKETGDLARDPKWKQPWKYFRLPNGKIVHLDIIDPAEYVKAAETRTFERGSDMYKALDTSLRQTSVLFQSASKVVKQAIARAEKHGVVIDTSAPRSVLVDASTNQPVSAEKINAAERLSGIQSGRYRNVQVGNENVLVDASGKPVDPNQGVNAGIQSGQYQRVTTTPQPTPLTDFTKVRSELLKMQRTTGDAALRHTIGQEIEAMDADMEKALQGTSLYDDWKEANTTWAKGYALNKVGEAVRGITKGTPIEEQGFPLHPVPPKMQGANLVARLNKLARDGAPERPGVPRKPSTLEKAFGTDPAGREQVQNLRDAADILDRIERTHVGRGTEQAASIWERWLGGTAGPLTGAGLGLAFEVATKGGPLPVVLSTGAGLAFKLWQMYSDNVKVDVMTSTEGVNALREVQMAKTPSRMRAAIAKLENLGAGRRVGDRASAIVAPFATPKAAWVAHRAAGLTRGGLKAAAIVPRQSSRSLAAAMALPVNKGKSEAEVEQHLRSLGYNVTRP